MYQYTGIRQGRRRSLGGCISGLVVLLLIISGLGFVLTRAHNGVTLTVGAHPTIIADDCHGPVLIQAGAANQVTLGAIFPQYQQDASTNTLEITECANMTITVPPTANIQVNATDTITVLGVSGTLNLSTNGSRITLEQVTLEGQSKISDNGGAIVINGNVAPGSTPTISNNSGSIDITLPANSSFHLTLTGNPGPIASSFPGVQNPASAAGDMQVDIGGNPASIKLTLDLNDTAVVLNAGA